MKVIIGLGNPGKRYENTRHNLGFRAVGELASQLDISVIKSKHNALIGDKIIDGEKIMLVKPLTFMNLSGRCVWEILAYYKIQVDALIIVYDDCALPVGSVRARETGSDGGHNGIKSIIESLGTQKFKRVRIGIGVKPPGWDLADYVLGAVPNEDKEDVERGVKDAAACVRHILTNGMADAMNKYNKRIKNDESGEEE